MSDQTESRRLIEVWEPDVLTRCSTEQNGFKTSRASAVAPEQHVCTRRSPVLQRSLTALPHQITLRTLIGRHDAGKAR
jgi:hypothetical protein